jgi:hypothetical protein
MTYTTIEDPVLIQKALEMRESGMYVSDIAKTLSEETRKRITQMALWQAFENQKKQNALEKNRKNKKRRQGQNGATPKLLCPKCGEYLKRNYIRDIVNGKQCFVKSGWTCPSSACDYIVKDHLKLENIEEPESINELEND